MAKTLEDAEAQVADPANLFEMVEQMRREQNAAHFKRVAREREAFEDQEAEWYRKAADERKEEKNRYS